MSGLMAKLLGDRCGCCGLPARPRRFCSGCQEDLLTRGPGCRFCGTPMARNGMVCGRCLQTTHHYQQLLFAHDYAGPLAEIIKGLKYHEQLAAAPALGNLLAAVARSAQTSLPADCRWLAMPMHPARYRQRGYNQAALLVQYCAKQLGFPWQQPVRRTVSTQALETLDRKARERAVRNAFCAQPVSGHWVLVDDVFTTGASANAVSRVLKKAGALSVTVLCLARTPLRDDSHYSLLNGGFRDIQAAEGD